MHRTHWIARTAIVWLLAALLGGCVKESPTVLVASVVGAADLNPDPGGQAAPVVVRFYELKSAKAFDAAAFFDIYDNAQQTLGADLLNWAELEVVPGSTRTLTLKLGPLAQQVGVIVAYRDIDHARWRAKIAIATGKTIDVTVHAGKLAVAVTPG